MILQYTLTANDYESYGRYLMETGDFKKRIRGQSLIAAGLVLLCGVAAMLILKRDYLVTSLAAAAGAAVIALVFPLIAKAGTKAALVNSIKQDDGSMFREQTLTVGDNGIRVESSDGEEVYAKEFTFPEIEDLVPFEGIYLMHFQNGNLLIVPKSAFGEGQEEAFRALFGAVLQTRDPGTV